MTRPDPEFIQRWHTALNRYIRPQDFVPWMYLAKTAADEVERLTMLFGMEREGKLPTVHHQCSHDTQGTPVVDNHLTCALGVACRACGYLQTFDGRELKPDEQDRAKAWTCVTHILTETAGPNGFDTSEGFVVTEDDKMYWSHVYESWAAIAEQDDEEEGE